MVNMVKKIYMCPSCKKNHNIEFPADLAKNRSKYPFTYVFIHKFEGQGTDISEIEADILTTMYIDADLNIRGVETVKQEGVTDVVSKEVTNTVAQNLVEQIIQLQQDYNTLLGKYEELQVKYKKLGGK